ncbi:muts domain V-domain-containing protein [Kickxella alabastrina]|uniref:muts domain V-domain-containing protein n=1 Tax=Kickxella alabastrina TaxID=61397 RepID=UPI00221E5CE3|nr:muts domain V-domain-containing protein [Kickxella alabastrina]KAI7828283.1 muts domain V-domain-containing protein [Kickxella alabastrina]
MSATPATDSTPNDKSSSSDQSQLLRFISTLPAQPPNTLRLFERPEYFTAIGADATYIATTVFKTTSVLKRLGTHPTCTLSRTICESFLRDALLSQGQRVEIYRAPNQQQQAGEWQYAVCQRDMVDAPLMAVHVSGSGEIGVGFVDPAQRTLGVCVFTDSDVFSNLEALVIQLGVRECLVVEERTASAARRRLASMLARCNVVLTACERALFSAKNIEQDLARLLNTTAPVAALPELLLTLALGPLACALQYLGLLSDDSAHGTYAIRTHSLAQFMKLDASALDALNLLHRPQMPRNMSLQGLLDRCRTAQGRRLLAQWLKQPLVDRELIERRLDLVEVFFVDAERRNALRQTHCGLQGGARASLQDIVRVYQLVNALPALGDALSHAAAGSEQQDAREAMIADSLGPLRDLVETTVDLEMADQHEFMLRADFDEALQDTRAQMDSAMDLILAQLQQVSDALDLEAYKKVKLEKHASFGYCLRVSRVDAARLRGKSRFFELATLKTGVFFTTAALRDAARAWAEQADAYAKTQAELVREVVRVAASYCPLLAQLNALVAHLDVVLAFAEASASAPVPYTRPRVGAEVLRLVDARHPCLEVQDGVSFIANGVEMARGRSDFAIITGPNMGGKSTYIRQIGVIALMAQIGCFVPCESAELPLFDCILARVGAGDAQMKGVSTFMAEMLETASILKTASERSLVIIDELGRGTSTCLCLFATHFHELTELQREFANVDNLHVIAKISEGAKDLTLLYRIGKGVCDQSFGIHVAELANFPESVVRLAKRKTEGLDTMHPEQIAARVNELEAKYRTEISANPWVQSIISTL